MLKPVKLVSMFRLTRYQNFADFGLIRVYGRIVCSRAPKTVLPGIEVSPLGLPLVSAVAGTLYEQQSTHGEIAKCSALRLL